MAGLLVDYKTQVSWFIDQPHAKTLVFSMRGRNSRLGCFSEHRKTAQLRAKRLDIKLNAINGLPAGLLNTLPDTNRSLIRTRGTSVIAPTASMPRTRADESPVVIVTSPQQNCLASATDPSESEFLGRSTHDRPWSVPQGLHQHLLLKSIAVNLLFYKVFLKHIGCTPSPFYLSWRLNFGRRVGCGRHFSR